MATVLAVLALLSGFGLAGHFLLRRHFTGQETWTLLALTLTGTILVTALRYQIAVESSAYEALTSDTFRYLLYGRARWLGGESVLDGLTAGDGTLGTITLSQLAFLLLGDNWFAVFLAGSLVGLLGCWLIAATIRTIRPDSGMVLPLLACLFPSVLYWSSSFGKEAFSTAAVGLAAYALARRSTGRARQVPVAETLMLVVAIPLAWTVRPEVAVLIVGATIAAWLAVRLPPSTGLRRPVVLLGLVGVPLGLLVAGAAGYSDPLGLLENLTSRHERTSIGDAQIGSARPGGAAGLIVGVPTAVFRPLPWEAGLAGLGSSLDTVLILYAVSVLWRSRSRLGSLDTANGRLLVFALAVALVLFGPLAGYGNLGLLARMRSLVIPALIIVIAVCAVRREGNGPVETGRPTVQGRTPGARLSRPPVT